MRAWEDLTYQEFKEGVSDAMRRHWQDGWPVEQVVDNMVEEDSEADQFVGTSTALWIISLGAYEVEHAILEDRVLIELSYHIPRFHMGKYTDDLTEEEYEQVAEDVKFIESKVELYKLESYEDDEE